MSSPHDAVVIVVCKAPEKGRVKTRLAKDIGEERASHVYSVMMATLFANLHAGVDYDVCACVDGDITLVQAGNLEPIPQRGADLGERIINAMEDCSGYPKMIVIGSDTPTVTSSVILRTMNDLDTVDVVIGPAADGGYYLIGMKEIRRELFDNINWSTDAVCAQTVEHARAHNLRISKLETLRDIDTVHDLQAVMPSLFDALRYS